MKKTLFVLFIFLFSGCSMDRLVLWSKLDKVELVKQTSYTKHYRAYFQREHLKPIRHGKKYLFFYNRQTKDLAVLLHPGKSYKLYNITHPSLIATTIRTDRKHGYYHMLRTLRKRGFRPASPSKYGFTVSVAPRRYKDVKTYRIDVKDYRRLIARYKYAIRTYNAKKVKYIKSRLPLGFIRSYYMKYQAKAVTEKQKKQLRIIGIKLGIYKQPKEKELLSQSNTTPEKQAPKAPLSSKDPENLYHYYMHSASFYELQNYLSTSEAKSVLTYNQYNTLMKRYKKLKEEKLLREGTLEELISAYKKNNNPKYKAKILARMKELKTKKK